MTSRLTIESGKKLSDHKTFVLTISDSLGYESFAIAAPHLQGSSDSDSSTVQFYRSGEGFGSMLDLVESGVYEGLIQGRSGQSLPVVIYYNLNRQVHGGSPIKVSVRRDTDLLYLYRAVPGSTNQ